MKNLVHVKDLEDLPIDTRNFNRPHRGVTHQVRLRTKWRDWTDRKLGDYTAYTICRRILRKSVNQPWDEVYAEISKRVPAYLRRDALHWQVDLQYEKRLGQRWWRRNMYFIDDEGLLQEDKPTEKKIWTIPSDDYKVQWVLDSSTIKNRLGVRLIKVYDREYDVPWYYSQHYKRTVVQGELLQFTSKQDPKFKRIHAERKKKRRKTDRNIKKVDKERVYCMLSKSEQQKKQEALENQISIQSHGFDPKWSFTQSDRRE